jgi:hypothetical protein
MKRRLYHAGWATTSDDAPLRRLLRETMQEGRVTLGFEREPSFFADMPDACGHDTVVVRRAEGAEIVGCGTRTDRRAWLHGREQIITYLGDLRVHPDHRHVTGRVLQAGFERLRELARQQPTAITYTAIFDDNLRARRALDGGRIGLPFYHDQGALHTAAILVPRKTVQTGEEPVDPEEVAAFLNERRRLRDLSPLVQADHLKAMSTMLVSRHAGRINGVVALGDFRDRRQMRVHGYQGAMRLMHHPLGWLLRLCGYRSMTAPGDVAAALFVCFLEFDNLILGRSLLRQVRTAAATRGASMLLLTQHENDPLRQVANHQLALRSQGRLYEVAWDASAPVTSLLSPHVEGFSL